MWRYPIPITTSQYYLSAFLDGDSLSSVLDKRRFSTIDNQLYRVSEVIGDGRIDGWEITESDFPNVIVSAGSGLIDKYYVNTFDDQIFELSPDGIFWFYVQHRVGAIGIDGPKSDIVSIGYTDDGAPAQPTGLSINLGNEDVNNIYSFLINLNWSANIEVDLDHYRIERSTDGVIFTTVSDDVSLGDTSYIDSVLEDTTYYYRLSAIDQSDNPSTPATDLIVVPQSTVIPPNPLDVQVPESEAAINILWKRPAGIPFNRIEWWKITYVRLNSDNTEISSTKIVININSDLLYYRIDDLISGQRYKITIQTVDDKSRESVGVVKNVVPQPSPAPRDPTFITFTESQRASATGNNTITVNLSWVEGDTPYDPASSYRFKIYVIPEGQAESIGIDVPIGFTAEQIELYSYDLVNYNTINENSLYTFRLTALDQSGFESFGSYARFITSTFSQPKRVSNLQAVWNRDNRTLKITWLNQTDTSYVHLTVLDEDTLDEYDTATELIDENIGLVQNYVINDIELYHTYTIRVTAYNAADIPSSTASTSTITNPPEGNLPLPQPPANIDFKSGDREIIISWSQSETTYVSQYRIYKKQGDIVFDADDWELLDTVPSTLLTFYDFGVENDTTYSYYITAIDIYGRESLHLADEAFNVPIIQAVAKRGGVLTEPENVNVAVAGSQVVLVWESLSEEFDSFIIHRSINNLHSWEQIATVDKSQTTYTDISLPLIDGTVFYYVIEKTANDSDIIAQTTATQPSNSIFIGKVTTSDEETAEFTIDISDRRDIKDLSDPLSEYTEQYLLPHKHTGTGKINPERIDLNPELIVANWTTVDGRIFMTAQDISGNSYVLKVNNRFPTTFYSVDALSRRVLFSEAIAEIDPETLSIIGEVPSIELRVLGVEEVQNELDAFRFNNLHARQIQFGSINKEQLPSLNHEGRIREKLLPDRFSLERYDNHTFVVSEGNTDDRKTFGNGTTFYTTIAADGNIKQVVDFDDEEDGSLVMFNKPSYSDTTIDNLAQSEAVNSIGAANDNANYYRFVDDNLYLISASELFSMKVAPESYSTIGNVTANFSVITSDHINKTFYGLVNSTDTFYRFNPITGETTGSLTFTGRLFRGVAYDGDRDVIYSHDITNNEIVSIKYNTGEINNIGNYTDTAAIHDFAYAPISGTRPNGILYAAQSSLKLVSIDLDTAAVTFIRIIGFLAITYDNRDHSLYGATTINLRKYDINANTVTSLVFPTSKIMAGIDHPNFDWWVPANNTLNIGDYYNLLSDTYLRFPINVPKIATVSHSDVSFKSITNSTGSSVNIEVSYLDPSYLSDNTDLSSSAILSIPAMESVQWQVLPWSTNESGDDTSIDIGSLISNFISRDDYFQGKNILLRLQTLGTTAEGNNRRAYSYNTPDNAPILNTSYVIDDAEVDSEFGGFQSDKSYRLAFEFADIAPTRWVRVSTASVPTKPNPIIDLSNRIRFRVYFAQGSIYLTLGVREIEGANLTVGNDGGIVGPIEWIGASSIVSDSDGSIAPIGMLIEGKDEWQIVDIDLRKASCVSFSGGNSSLSSGFGVLDHFAFTVNPDSSSTVVNIFIDKIEQVNDLLVAGTSQGILLSEDFGVNWSLSRLTNTPVHKFYRAKNNSYLWAITATEVLLATDPAYWFATQGTTGIKYIRDIAEDDDGNMYISTDKGVYWLEIALIRTLARFKQTRPINAFSTDTYALYHNTISSGIDDIWASTEIGIFKTTDKGQTWDDSGLDTSGLVCYKIIEVGNALFGITRKHVLRKLHGENNFSVAANLEQQHGISKIWNIVYFSDRLYISTEKGVFINDFDTIFSDITINFEKTLDGLDYNDVIRVAFGMDVVAMDTGSRLFLGQENRLAQADENNTLSVKKQFKDKEIPSFYIDDVETNIGYIYNSFNNVVIFREPIQVNKIITAAYLPRRSYFAINGGWSQTNPEADIFVYKNGEPSWLDFIFDEASILSELQALEGKLRNITNLNTFNSHYPLSQTYLDNTLTSITKIRSGGENGSTLTNKNTIVEFMDNYTRFLALITEQLANNNQIEIVPLKREGITREQRSTNSRAEILETKEDFVAKDSTDIEINIVTGEIDFINAFTNSTDLEKKATLSFTKYDNLEITIFNSNIQGTGEFTHYELEDKQEAINTGLTSSLARATYTDLIELGIFLEGRNNYMFDRYNVSRIQSAFYAAYTNSWYDQINSTVDYDFITGIDSPAEPTFSTIIKIFINDSYYYEKIWVGTNADIYQFGFSESRELVLESIVRPNPLSAMYIWDIYLTDNDSTVYVVAADKTTNKGYLFVSYDFGLSFTELPTNNLPNEIYTFRLVGGNKVVSTNEGLFYSDNENGNYFPCNFTQSLSLIDTDPLDAVKRRVFNVSQSTFIIIEAERWFYQSGQGVEFLALNGRLSQNDASIVNKIFRFKNITWAATDKGLYNDGNTILTESTAFSLERLEPTLSASIDLSINDISCSSDALYCCGSNGKIYRYWDDPNDNLGNEWKSYEVPDFGAIHRILIYENGSNHYMIVCSYNKLRLLDVTPETGVFNS